MVLEANNQEMEKKLNLVLAQNKSYSDSVKNIQTSTGAAIPKTGATYFRSIMKETRKADIAEESEKKRRVCNFIIHGVEEKSDTDKNVNKKHDEDYVHTFIGALEIRSTAYKSVVRIGRADQSRLL